MGFTERKKAVVAVLLIIVSILAGIVIWRGQGEKVTAANQQEFVQLQVVQFYLHMPAGDYIIGREKPAFSKVTQLITKAVLAVKEPSTGLEPFTEAKINELKRQNIAVSAWLMEEQKISTAAKAKTGANRDKYGNGVITTDRLMFILGGKFKGNILVREPSSGKWYPWRAQEEQFRQLVDLIRAGGL